MGDIKIFCPVCGWEPDGGAYWQCSYCHTVWNTFDTAARCPGCGYQYKYTQCIEHMGGCPAESLHIDWYHGLDKIVEDAFETEPVSVEKKELTPVNK